MLSLKLQVTKSENAECHQVLAKCDTIVLLVHVYKHYSRTVVSVCHSACLPVVTSFAQCTLHT